jgi:hypothetical protein
MLRALIRNATIVLVITVLLTFLALWDGPAGDSAKEMAPAMIATRAHF